MHAYDKRVKKKLPISISKDERVAGRFFRIHSGELRKPSVTPKTKFLLKKRYIRCICEWLYFFNYKLQIESNIKKIVVKGIYVSIYCWNFKYSILKSIELIEHGEMHDNVWVVLILN